MKKYKIAFICVHNSCRSQIAEAIAKKKYSDMFLAYSAGVEKTSHINSDAIATIKKIYDYDISSYKSKLVGELDDIDIVITMGCNVSCPYVECSYTEDFGLADPTGKDYDIFALTARLIDEKINTLYLKIKYGELKI